MESVILVLLGLLAVAVVYVLTSLRHYQRVDYSALLEQEDYTRTIDSRIIYLEELIGSQQARFAAREHELADLLTATRQQYARELNAAQVALAAAPLPVPPVTPAPEPVAEVAPPALAPATVLPEPQAFVAAFTWPALVNPRQMAIVEELAAGHSVGEISRRLHVSGHEIELVAAMQQRRLSA